MAVQKLTEQADSYDEYTFGAPVTHITQLRALEQVYLVSPSEPLCAI
jgi:hypothetical protein